MNQRAYTDEQLQDALQAVQQYGTIAAAAAALGENVSTFDKRYRRAKAAGEVFKPLPLKTAPYLKKLKASSCRRFVITAAQNATNAHAGFLASLLCYCRERKAQLIVIPYRYRNPTSFISKGQEDDDWWDPELVPFLLDKRFDACRSLTVLADIKTQPTAVNPLSGFETISGARSAVIAHSKIELTVVPTPHEKRPKILATTGAVTKKNYTPTKAGKKGEFHHSLGAALIEVDGPHFHLRQLNGLSDGSFIDLDRVYTASGSHKAPPAEALVLGDGHELFADPIVTSATFGKGGMVQTLRPKLLVRHDSLDFYSGSPHHRGRVFTRFAKHLSGLDDVRAELELTFGNIDRTTPAGVQNVIVASNHHEHFRRWMEETDPRTDLKNLMLWAETFVAMGDATRMTDHGAETLDPFTWWGQRLLRCASRTRFLKRDESCRIAGIEVGYHGDQGANGARGHLTAFNKIGAKTVTGHSHTPGIREGAYAVGTSSRLRLEYNQGPSSWLQTHCVIYANGKRSLLSVINGRWKL